MILCLEQLVFFERLSEEQDRVWASSMDVGIELTVDNKDEIRDHIKQLNEDLEVVQKWDATHPYRQWQRTWFLPVEHDEGGIAGYEIEFLYFKGRGKEFLAIDVTHNIRPE